MRPLRPRVIDDDADHDQFFAATGDRALEAIIKWIPIEVIAAFEFTIGVVPVNQPNFHIMLAVGFTALTGAWIAFATIDPESPRPIAWRQVILSTFAFAIWILGTQPNAVKAVVQSWEAWIGSIILGLGWLLLPILNGVLIRARISQS